MFEVGVVGYPEPSVEFYLKGQQLKHNPDVGIEIQKQDEGHYKITLQNCQIDAHDGEILARAINEHGQAESRACLTVEPEEEESRSAPTFIKDIEDQVLKFIEYFFVNIFHFFLSTFYNIFFPLFFKFFC